MGRSTDPRTAVEFLWDNSQLERSKRKDLVYWALEFSILHVMIGSPISWFKEHGLGYDDGDYIIIPSPNVIDHKFWVPNKNLYWSKLEKYPAFSEPHPWISIWGQDFILMHGDHSFCFWGSLTKQIWNNETKVLMKQTLLPLNKNWVALGFIFFMSLFACTTIKKRMSNINS